MTHDAHPPMPRPIRVPSKWSNSRAIINRWLKTAENREIPVLTTHRVVKFSDRTKKGYSQAEIVCPAMYNYLGSVKLAQPPPSRHHCN